MTSYFPPPRLDYRSLELQAMNNNVENTGKRIQSLSCVIKNDLHPDKALDRLLTREERVKLRGISARHDGLSPAELVKEAAGNPAAMRYLSRELAKSPRRQGLHEKCAHKYLESTIAAVSSPIQTLPKSGVGAMQLTDRNQAKSMDFLATMDVGDRRMVLAVAHKFTSENGGAQDHQCKELQRLVGLVCDQPEALAEKVKHATGATDVFIAVIADGAYYEKGPGKKSLDSMKSACKENSDIIMAGCIEDLPESWARYVGRRVSVPDLPVYARAFVQQALDLPAA